MPRGPLAYLGPSSATTSDEGIVELATTAETVTGTDTTKAVTPAGVAAVAIAGAPDASESTKGILKLSTSALATGATDDATAMTPLKVAEVLAAPSAIGGTTPAAGTFTTLTADSTGAISLDADAASHFSVAGAGIDLTFASAAGRVIVNGEKAADNAITLLSAAGGIDADAALQISLQSTENAADAVEIISTAGGIDILASGSGGAGEDIDIVCTGGSVNISGTENVADAVTIAAANGGIDITAGGAAGEDLDLVCTSGSANLSGGEDVADAVVISAGAGGIDILATGEAGQDIDIKNTGGSINITATENNAGAIIIEADGGTSEKVQIHSDQGTGTDSIYLFSDVGGLTLESTGLASDDAINLVATAGGIDMDAAMQINIASSENTADSIVIESTAGGLDILASSSGGAGEDIDIVCTGGSVNISGTENVADAVTIAAANGGIDITCGGAAAEDIDIVNTAGSIFIQGGEDDAACVLIEADGGTSERVHLHSDQGTGTDSIFLESDVGGITLTATALANAAALDLNAPSGGCTIDTGLGVSIDAAGASNFSTSGAEIDLDLASAAGRVIITAGEDAADAIYLHADAGTGEKIRIHADQGTGVDSVELESDVGGITLTSGLASADAINLTASSGGVDIDGALQINIASSQAAAGAVTIAASHASGSITHTGACVYTPDSITSDNAGVAASVSTQVTLITTDGDSNEDNVTLADGLASGQVKHFAVIAAGNAADSVKITPAHMAGGSKITFAADPTGLGCSMVFDGTNWTVFANNGGTIA